MTAQQIISELREKTGDTYNRLAIKLGVSECSVYFWAHGGNNPSPVNMAKLEALLSSGGTAALPVSRPSSELKARLARYMAEHGLSQPALATLVKISKRQLGRWLNEEAMPNVFTMDRINELLSGQQLSASPETQAVSPVGSTQPLSVASDRVILAARLKAYMETYKLPCDVMASMLQVNYTTMLRWINLRRNPRVDTLLRIEALLAAPPKNPELWVSTSSRRKNRVELQKAFSSRLLEVMKESGSTEEELAAYLGVLCSTLHGWMCGGCLPHKFMEDRVRTKLNELGLKEQAKSIAAKPAKLAVKPVPNFYMSDKDIEDWAEFKLQDFVKKFRQFDLETKVKCIRHLDQCEFNN